MSEFGSMSAQAFSAFCALSIGAIWVAKRFSSIDLPAWLLMAGFAFGQVGLGLRFHAPEPYAFILFLSANVFAGALVTWAIAAAYRRAARG